ncbi:MAG TPA: HEAT repeat domain-containing protein, partial [Thermodesulfobacteriota bacterium]|nr:HEAT repeat domain-containing protein [Thermodesulfobacteriota bacterium]
VFGTLGYIVARLWAIEREEADWAARVARYDAAVLEVVNAADPLACLAPLAAARGRDREAIATLLCSYGERLRGEGWENVVRAMGALGLVAEQLALLDDRRWWVRARGAWRIGLLEHRPAAPRLLRLLDDPHPFVRVSAALAASRLGDPALIAPLVDRFGRGADCQPLLLKTLLERFGARAVPSLRGLLAAEEPVLRQVAVELLGRFGDARSADAITALLDDPDPELRIKAAKALRSIGTEAACRKLLTLVDDDAWQLRAMAIKTLGDLGYRPALDALVRALGDEHFTVRLLAGRALLALGPEGRAALARCRGLADRYARDVVEQMLADAGA